MSSTYKHPLPGVPLIESPFLDEAMELEKWDDETKRIGRELSTRGYAVVDFPEPELDSIIEQIKASLHHQYDWKSWRAHGGGLRVQDAWRDNANVRRLATNSKIVALLSRLYGRRAWPFQTLNFPVGTQQHFHTDSIHFSSSPERFMCGVWIALEDIHPDAGPLVYFPGSHRWPIYTNEHIGECVSERHAPPDQTLYEPLWQALVRAHRAAPERFLAKKGQALIWAANLLHGGDAHPDRSRTRWSQVTHYFFDDCAYYTPMYSDPFYGRISFRPVANIESNRPMPHRYAGRDISKEFIAAATNELGLKQRASDLAKAFAARLRAR